MRLLLTNDDGIDAPGLTALLDAIRALGEPAVVAPAAAHSGCSHKVTTDRPLRIVAWRPAGYAVEGTPADCVRVALHRLAPDAAWVLSGINHGGNLGADVWHSGTAAAAREAVLHGRPAAAVSQYKKKALDFDWPRSAAWAAEVLRDLLGRPWTPGTFWNINMPHLAPGDPEPEVVFCRLDPSPLPLSFAEEGDQLRYNGDYHGRRRVPGADVDVCFGGNIAVTRIALL
jgi:5'-nucleotidase